MRKREYTKTGKTIRLPSGVNAIVYRDGENNEFVRLRSGWKPISQAVVSPGETPEVKERAEELKFSPSIVSDAVEIAKNLTAVIDSCRMYTTIQGKKYIHVEGWQALGAATKCHAVISGVEKTDAGYTATAEVCDFSGNVISRGIGIAEKTETLPGKKESRWKDGYALSSMAQTRAISRAYRNAFAWIIRISGYETTPAEEI